MSIFAKIVKKKEVINNNLKKEKKNMKKIIDTVNFDYPICGGYEVWEKSPHFFSVRQFSNYQGQKTHRYYVVKETTAEDALAMVREGRAEDCVTRKGWKVQ